MKLVLSHGSHYLTLALSCQLEASTTVPKFPPHNKPKRKVKMDVKVVNNTSRVILGLKYS